MKLNLNIHKLYSTICQFAYVTIVSFIFPILPVSACISEKGTLNIPNFIIIFIIIIFFALMLTFFVWLIEKIFFQHNVQFSVFRVFLLLFSILISMFGIYVIPVFAEMFASFKGKLPFHTEMIIAVAQYLWLTTCLVLALFYFLQNNPNKNKYFTVILFSEASLLLWILWGLYLPIFTMGCG